MRVALGQHLRTEPQPFSGPRGQVLHEHVSVIEQPVDNLPGLRVLEVKCETLLGAIEPDEVARHSPHRLIVVTCKVPHIGTLDLHHACSQVGQLARGERGRNCLFK